MKSKHVLKKYDQIYLQVLDSFLDNIMWVKVCMAY